MTQQVERMLPLYESKMIHQFDHRWATYEVDGAIRDVTLAEKQDPSFRALPRYWVREEVVGDRADQGGLFLGFRDITNSTNERTVISSLIPLAGVGNNLPLVLAADNAQRLRLLAFLNSFVLDYLARPKVAGVHLNFFIANQLAVPTPMDLTGPTGWCPDIGEWIDQRARWLMANAEDIAEALGVPSHPLDGELRPIVRAELDAAFFHHLEVSRNDVDYIMETFPIVKRKDMAAHGTYRTKELILEIYDAMQAAIDTSTSYRSPFDQEQR